MPSQTPQQCTGPVSAADSMKVLLDQYRLLEERRMYFGRQFMQTVGFVGGVLAVLIGLLGEENATLLRWALGVGGVASLLLAVLAFRLGVRQKQCEEELTKIEEYLRRAGNPFVATLEPGAQRFGARNLIVSFLVLFGALLLSGAIAGVSPN